MRRMHCINLTDAKKEQLSCVSLGTSLGAFIEARTYIESVSTAVRRAQEHSGENAPGGCLF